MNKFELPVALQANVTHAIAECCDCSWRSEDYKSVHLAAKIHALRYDHRVRCEQTVVSEYQGK